ncbi:MAG: hypothetical protein JWO11_1697 [Nocardioides sp.]|nr:hypothetical protein [Nocardioides sp.]
MEEGEGSSTVPDAWDSSCPSCGDRMLPRLTADADLAIPGDHRPLSADVPIRLECPTCSPSY